MKLLHCSHCGSRVFFESVQCVQCQALLGFVPERLEMFAFEPIVDEAPDSAVRWRPLGGDLAAHKPCVNYTQHQVCNWVLPADDPHDLCRSCQTTAVIPALSEPANLQAWFQLEKAKRRVLYTLLSLGLPFPGKAEDPQDGLSFEFLAEAGDDEPVLTGHDNGTITMNIAEADDAHRERVRQAMHEPYRTVLGHFRHEIGHYYWDRLINVQNGRFLKPFRERFGDERADYAETLKQHYEQGPPPDWADHFVSAYSTMHPWEDWAECWAHYLHLYDGLDTAAAWGVSLERGVAHGPPVVPAAIVPEQPDVKRNILEQWLPVSQFVNAMTRSLGIADGYPFVLSAPVLEKLQFIHEVVQATTWGKAPMRFGSPPPPPAAPPAPAAAPAAPAAPSPTRTAPVKPA